MIRLPFIFLLSLFSLDLFSQGQVYVVTNTLDAGDGSLRQALVNAGSAEADTIVFAIPVTDPGFDPATGVWSIATTGTYQIPESTVLYGGIALGSEADPRPGVEIHGNDSLVTLGITGLRLGPNVTLRNFIVNRFQYGIWSQFAGVTIENCYVGTDATGSLSLANGADGILLADGATDNLIQNNLISGNDGAGIRLFGPETTSNTLIGNKIGTNREGSEGIPNGQAGIQMHAGTHGNRVLENLVSGNIFYGIWLFNNGTSDNLFENNLIGTDVSGAFGIPNAIFGMVFFEGPDHNTFGPGNLVAFNGNDGVLVDGSDQTFTLGNRITMNSIHDNQGMGINILRGGNNEIPSPSIDSIVSQLVYGSAGSGDVIELFFDEGDEGCCFVARDTADAGGNFVIALSDDPADPLFLTATATDGEGNTSEFSAPFCLGLRPNIFDGEVSFCEGMSVHLGAGPYDQYSWSTGATTEVITVESPGTYRVTVTDDRGCSGEDSVQVNELPNPVVSIATMASGCANMLLNAGDFASYQWSTGDTLATITSILSGNYGVTVTDSNGCTAQDSVLVPEDPLQLPWVQELIHNSFNPYCDECLTFSQANWMDTPVLIFAWDASACHFTDLGFFTIYNCEGDTLQHCSTSIAGENCNPDQMINRADLNDVRSLWQCDPGALPECPSGEDSILTLSWLIDSLDAYEALCDLACAGSNSGNLLYRHLIDTQVVLELRTTCSEVIRRFYDCEGSLIYICTSFSETGVMNCDLDFLPSLDAGELIWECPSTPTLDVDKEGVGIKVFPTIFSEYLEIEKVPKVSSQVIFYDGFGRVLEKKIINADHEKIDTKNFPRGIVYARFILGTSSSMMKLMKIN